MFGQLVRLWETEPLRLIYILALVAWSLYTQLKSGIGIVEALEIAGAIIVMELARTQVTPVAEPRDDDGTPLTKAE
jgi:hypothetical protein